MKIHNIVVFDNFGKICLQGEKAKTEIDINEAQCSQFMILAYEIFEQHKPELATAISQVFCPALPSPDIVEGEYTET